MYGIIERIIAKVIPLWNMTLTPLQEDFSISQRIEYNACVYDPDPEDIPDEEKPQEEEDEDEDDYYERLEAWEDSIRKLVLPEPGVFKPRSTPPESACDLRKTFGQRGLQVIVKLANIHLTPEKPAYDGGVWHVEGQLVRSSSLPATGGDANVRRMNTSAPRRFIIIQLRTSRKAASLSGNCRTTRLISRTHKIVTTG
jgi:hypothetical protein